MAIPKKHGPRVEKFVEIVLGKVVRGESERGFFNKGALDPHYTISLYAVTLLPMYNDGRIEVSGDINGKKIDTFILDNESLVNNTLDNKLVKDIAQAFMTLRIKEVK